MEADRVLQVFTFMVYESWKDFGDIPNKLWKVANAIIQLV